MIVIWNVFQPWPDSWWGSQYLIVSIIIPCIVAIITTVWFFIGGVIDLRKMFQALKSRPEDDLDNGLVEGRVSLSDRKKFEQIESRDSKN